MLLSKTKLRPPDHDFFIINIDAAFNSRGAQIGVIARNSKGIPLLLWSGQSKASNSIEAEVIAIRRGISLASVKGW